MRREGRTQTLLPAFKRLNKQSLEKWGNLIIHQLSFFLGLNASVYTLQTQECTQNGFSSLSTLHPKKAGADTQVWMTLHPPLPHLQPRSFLHNTQTPFLRLPFEVETPSTFPVNLADFFGSNPCAASLRRGGYSSQVLCCKSSSGSEK